MTLFYILFELMVWPVPFQPCAVFLKAVGSISPISPLTECRFLRRTLCKPFADPATVRKQSCGSLDSMSTPRVAWLMHLSSRLSLLIMKRVLWEFLTGKWPGLLLCGFELENNSPAAVRITVAADLIVSILPFCMKFNFTDFISRHFAAAFPKIYF